MKLIYKTTILLLVITIVNSVSAQNFKEFSTGLKNGDLKEIASHLDEEVEISIMEAESYSRSEAEILLASFLNGNSPTNYTAIHKGTTFGNAHYQIGELKTDNETYRTYMYSKEMDGNYKIQEFRIEK